MTYCCTLLLYEADSRPQRASHMAFDLGALGGTRTPNLLIRRVCRRERRPGICRLIWQDGSHSRASFACVARRCPARIRPARSGRGQSGDAFFIRLACAALRPGALQVERHSHVVRVGAADSPRAAPADRRAESERVQELLSAFLRVRAFPRLVGKFGSALFAVHAVLDEIAGGSRQRPLMLLGVSNEAIIGAGCQRDWLGVSLTHDLSVRPSVRPAAETSLRPGAWTTGGPRRLNYQLSAWE
jgi:hypothetical protein